MKQLEEHQTTLSCFRVRWWTIRSYLVWKPQLAIVVFYCWSDFVRPKRWKRVDWIRSKKGRRRQAWWRVEISRKSRQKVDGRAGKEKDGADNKMEECEWFVTPAGEPRKSRSQSQTIAVMSGGLVMTAILWPCDLTLTLTFKLRTGPQILHMT